MPALKIVVTGPVCAGKTTFIRSLAEKDPVTTEQTVTNPTDKTETTVGLDFGRVDVADTSVRLFGTPGQQRFDYMWEVLSVGADGLILLVPGDRQAALRKSLAIVRHLMEDTLPPAVIGITRTDLSENDVPRKVRRALGSIAERTVRIDARDADQCRSLLASLIENV